MEPAWVKPILSCIRSSLCTAWMPPGRQQDSGARSRVRVVLEEQAEHALKRQQKQTDETSHRVGTVPTKQVSQGRGLPPHWKSCGTAHRG